ncbi:hypothetical protein MYX76_18210 [Desulfobacterota bacterium AH_259_B03_O07]|nr:hypothetical protein [Desulfobacterota bacterium AH_259_B03_O07]
MKWILLALVVLLCWSSEGASEEPEKFVNTFINPHWTCSYLERNKIRFSYYQEEETCKKFCKNGNCLEVIQTELPTTIKVCRCFGVYEDTFYTNLAKCTEAARCPTGAYQVMNLEDILGIHVEQWICVDEKEHKIYMERSVCKKECPSKKCVPREEKFGERPEAESN